MKLKPYPTQICAECGMKGEKHYRHGIVATFYWGTCEVCGKYKCVTEPRDFHYPLFKGHLAP